MAARLDILKEKLQQLLKEQISTKEQFTVFHFNSRVCQWREGLVGVSPQTLEAAAQWVCSLTTGGSTNTQEALVKAMTVRGAEAVYLMTDGRPDTPTDTLLARVQQLPAIPVHTISFNCADSKANHFLAKLASITGGRYHYFSDDVSDPEGPKTYQSEDITVLEEEIKCGLEQLSRANQLLAECQVTHKRFNQTQKSKKSTKPMTSSLRDSDSSISGYAKPLLGSKKWLVKNSLSALRLTVMDALGPASIPHSPKHVPLLNKSVHSRVFSQLFPLAHVSSNNKMTLIHPNGVNLVSYESRLQDQITVYKSRLTKLAWSVVPSNSMPSIVAKCGSSEEDTPSYWDHKEVLLEALSELDWPRPKLDFDLLEDEIKQAENYIRYSEFLREEAKKGTENETESIASTCVPLMNNPLSSTLARGKPSKPSKSTKVIARSAGDGFYYPGVVVSEAFDKTTTVRLADGARLSTDCSLVIPTSGAGPCPLLQRGDPVLVRVRASVNGAHPGTDGVCDYYIPGTVQVPPANKRKGHALYSVLVFNGRVVTCDRRGIIKVSNKRYSETCKYINDKALNDSTTDSDNETETHQQSESEYSRSSTQMPTPPPDSDLETEASFDSQKSPSSPTRSASADTVDWTAIKETQQAQHELIQQYRQELLTMQEKQRDLEEQLLAKTTVQHNSSPNDRCIDSEMSKESMEQTQAPVIESQDGVSAAEHIEPISSVGSSGDLDSFPDYPLSDNGETSFVEAGVNTDPVVEDAGTETGPLTQTVGVGTEFSSESDSDSVPDPGSNVGEDSESLIDEQPMPVETTPIPTPVATPPDSRSSSPTPSAQATPLPSTSHVTPSDPTPDHIPTPSLSQVSVYNSSPTVGTPNQEEAPVINQQVLAHWPDDGWYYRCIVVGITDGKVTVQDASGDTETMPPQDIITDVMDPQKTIELGATVAALHPNYSCSYAPGVVVGASPDQLSFTVDLYDGCQALLPRQELHSLPQDKYEVVTQYIRDREEAWVGVACVARSNSDGLYHPGKVLEHLSGTHCYLVEWSDGLSQETEIVHMFGQLSRKRGLRIGDHIVALADTKTGVCMPGVINGAHQGRLLVQFCDGQSDAVEPTHCFWIPVEYYQQSVAYMCDHTPSYTPTTEDTSDSNFS